MYGAQHSNSPSVTCHISWPVFESRNTRRLMTIRSCFTFMPSSRSWFLIRAQRHDVHRRHALLVGRESDVPSRRTEGRMHVTELPVHVHCRVGPAEHLRFTRRALDQVQLVARWVLHVADDPLQIVADSGVTQFAGVRTA